MPVNKGIFSHTGKFDIKINMSKIYLYSMLLDILFLKKSATKFNGVLGKTVEVGQFGKFSSFKQVLVEPICNL